MMYRTHLVTTLAVSLPVLTQTDSLSTGTLIALSIGSLMPDIDEPHSYIGSRTRGISDLIKVIFGHRGITHSFIGNIFISIAMFLICYLLKFPYDWAIWFTIGYFLHLLEDSFSKSGVAWLQPFSDKTYQSGFNRVYYRTGSFIENIIFIIAFYFLFIQVSDLDLGYLFSFV